MPWQWKVVFLSFGRDVKSILFFGHVPKPIGQLIAMTKIIVCTPHGQQKDKQWHETHTHEVERETKTGRTWTKWKNAVVIHGAVLNNTSKVPSKRFPRKKRSKSQNIVGHYHWKISMSCFVQLPVAPPIHPPNPPLWLSVAPVSPSLPNLGVFFRGRPSQRSFQISMNKTIDYTCLESCLAIIIHEIIVDIYI